ncbi:hypothetical protein FQN57_001627 [Myotisia sp. PD_48]|nr:hypothetical protein FQN57_001627 [Myotisia sp. PD_48]
MEKPTLTKDETFKVIHLHAYGFSTYYRIRTAQGVIKYFKAENPSGVTAFYPCGSLNDLGFSTVPAGDWNVAQLVKVEGEEEKEAADDRAVTKLVVGSVEHRPLASVKHVWHPNRLDHHPFESHGDPLDLSQKDPQCKGLILTHSIVPSPLHPSGVLISWEWGLDSVYGVDRETSVYSLIEGHDIGPTFLGHLTENDDRVVGYIVEKIHGRIATLEDLEACRLVLSKLHKLGIANGALDASNFLVTDEGRVVLHGFTACYRPADSTDLAKEMDSVEEVLRKGWSPPTPSRIDRKLRDELDMIYKRDDGLHDTVREQAERDGTITITEEEHKRMLKELRAGLNREELPIILET